MRPRGNTDSKNQTTSYVESQSKNSTLCKNMRYNATKILHDKFLHGKDFKSPEARKEFIALIWKDDDLRHRFVNLSTGDNTTRPDVAKRVKSRIKLAWRDKSTVKLQGLIKEMRLNNKAQEVVKLAEDLLITLALFSSACSKGSTDILLITIAVTNFVKLRTKRCLLLDKKVTDTVEFLIKAFSKIAILLINPDGPQLQSDGLPPGLCLTRKLLDHYATFKDSPLMTKLGDVCTYLVTLSVFDGIGQTCIPKDTWKMIKKGCQKDKVFAGPDFIYCLLDCVVFVCERGYQCFALQSWQPIVHSGNAYSRWMEESSEILATASFLGNPEAVGIDEHKYLADLARLVDEGAAIRETCTLMKIDFNTKKSVMKYYSELKFLKNTICTLDAAQKDRQCPLGVVISGGSSVAKSSFTNLLFYHYGRVEGKPLGDHYKYVRNSEDKFWSGAKTYHWCIILDDVAPFKPNICPNGDASVSELLRLINFVAINPNQAELADKGKTPLRPDVVYATTNTYHLNIAEYYQFPLAAQRRLPIVIDIKPKPEYCTHHMMDTSKIPKIDEHTLHYPDLWIISVYEVQPIIKEGEIPNRGSYKPLFTFDNIYEFLNYYTTIIKAHSTKQTRVDKSLNAIKTMITCKSCYLPTTHCRCGVEESLRQLRIPITSSTSVTDFSKPKLQSTNKSVLIARDGSDESVDFIRKFQTLNYDVHLLSMQPMNADSHLTLRECYLHLIYDLSRLPKVNYDVVIGPSYSAFTLLSCRLKLPYMSWANTFAIADRNLKEVMNIYQLERTPVVPLSTNPSSHQLNVGLVTLARLMDDRCTPLIVESRIHNFSATMYHYHSVLAAHSVWGCRWYGFWSDLIFGPMLACLYAFIAVTTMGPKEGVKKFVKAEAFRVGQRVQMACGHYSAATYCAAFAAGVMTLYTLGYIIKILRSKITMQSDVTSYGKTLAVVDPKRPSPVEVVDLSARDFHPYHFSYKDWDTDKATSYIQNNVVYVDFSSVKEGRKSVMLRLGGDYYLTTSHTVPREVCEAKVTCKYIGSNHLSTVTFMHTPANIVKTFGFEGIVLCYKSLPPAKSLKHFLPESPLSMGIFEGSVISRENNGSLYKISVDAIKRCTADITGPKGNTMPVKCWTGVPNIDTREGQCGSPYLINTSQGPCIVGIHIAGEKGRCYAEPIDQTIYEGLDMVFDGDINGGAIKIQSLDPRSRLNTIQGSLDVFGTLPDYHHQKMVSSVKATIIAKDLEELGYEHTHLPPPFGSEGNETWTETATNNAQIEHSFPDVLVEKCAKAFLKYVTTNLPEGSTDQLGVVNLDTAINGAAGVRYVDAIKKQTSSGFGHKGKKINHMVIKPDGRHTLNSALLSELQHVEDTYCSSTMYNPPFVRFPKDEPLPKSKVLIKKRFRHIACPPMVWTIWVKMYFGSLVALVQNNMFVFQCAPGITAQGADWDRMYKFLTKFGTHRTIAGDYSKFDQKIPANVVFYATMILIWIAEWSGKYTVEDLKKMKTSAYDFANPVYINMGDVYRSHGSNASGNPLTVIINCLCNILFMMLAWELLKPEEVELEDFFLYVRAMMYGDDNILTVSEGQDWFNHTAISKVLGELGITYTMADKEAESKPFCDIKDVEFLKRSFRYEPSLKAWVAPLRKESIIKSLMIGIPSPSICAQQQIVYVMSTALYEFSFHGRSEWEEWKSHFANIMDKHGLGPYAQPELFPSWEDLLLRYQRISEHGYWVEPELHLAA